MPPSPSDPSARLDDARLVAALARALPALELLEADLEFDGATIDRVGVDRTGRVWLAVRGDRGEAGVLEAAVDARALWDTLRAWLAQRHPGRVEAGASVSVVVVGGDVGARLARRLEAVATDCWRIDLRRVRSGGREHDLAQLESISGRAAGAGLAALPEVTRTRVALLARRLERIDERLETTEGPHERTWSLDGLPLARLWVRDGVAFAAVHEQEAHPLDGDAALERLVERCVEEYLGRAPAGGEVPGEELGEHELRPQPRRGTLPLIP